jgi:hypothetical protein
MLLSSSPGRQAKGLRHSSRGQRPRNEVILASSRPVGALHPFWLFSASVSSCSKICELSLRGRQSALIYHNSGNEPPLTGISLQKCAMRYGAFGIRFNSRKKLCASVPSAFSCSKIRAALMDAEFGSLSAIYAYLRSITPNYALFKKKKIVYFLPNSSSPFNRVFWMANPQPKSTIDLGRAVSPLTAALRNSKPKSTVGSPKSTFDLRLAPLIWVEKRSANTRSCRHRCSFRPITTWESKRADQKPANAERKVYAPSVDLECDLTPPVSPLSKPRMKKAGAQRPNKINYLSLIYG